VYTSSVMDALAWPNMRCTAFTLAPALTARDAAVWRRSCGVIVGGSLLGGVSLGGHGHPADGCLSPRCQGRCGNTDRRVDTVHGRRGDLEWLPRRRRHPRELGGRPSPGLPSMICSSAA
jgi:hypothetical protein